MYVFVCLFVCFYFIFLSVLILTNKLQLSILPVELARDIAIEPHLETNLPKTLSSLVLLTLIFAQGYPISAAHEGWCLQAESDLRKSMF